MDFSLFLCFSVWDSLALQEYKDAKLRWKGMIFILLCTHLLPTCSFPLFCKNDNITNTRKNTMVETTRHITRNLLNCRHFEASNPRCIFNLFNVCILYQEEVKKKKKKKKKFVEFIKKLIEKTNIKLNLSHWTVSHH